MSREARIPECALERLQGASGAECLVAIALYLHAKGGECWPSYATIEAYTGCDHRTVERMLKRLEGRGVLIERKSPNARRRSNTYILLTDGGEMTPSRQGEMTPQGGRNDLKAGDEMTPRTKAL